MARKNIQINAPLYLQVEATLKEMIEESVYATGEQIPSERVLSEQLGVSRMTVRKAIENLMRYGLLERRSTNGTFVRQPKVMRRVGKDVAVGLTQLLTEEGSKAGSKLLKFEEILAPLKVAEKLNLHVGEHVVMIQRLRTSNGLSFCVETSYIPRELVPDLTAGDLERPSASLYSIMLNRYQIKLSHNSETLKLSYATSEEANLLCLKEGDPVLLLRSVVMDESDRRVEYLKSVNHPGLVMFSSMSTLVV
ncbi:MAG: GntR family transcriptional regulator [Chloroflexota bacterium]